jgi:hypothetical protein
VSELTVKLPLVPLNVTAVAPVNALPVIVTVAPTPPLMGLKPVIVGCGTTVKLVELVPVPAIVVTDMGPVVAPDGAVAIISVSELTVVVAALVLLNATVLAAVNPVPVMVTEVPTTPLPGENEVIVGAPNTNSYAPMSQPACWGRVVPR